MENELPLDELRALLQVLRDNNVADFAGYGLSVTFGDPPAEVIKHTPPPTPPPIRSDFHNPRAWPSSNGKPINFDGTY